MDLTSGLCALRRRRQSWAYLLPSLAISTLSSQFIEKALLDETIAKKRNQLRSVTGALEENYKQLRSLTLRNFLFRASAECGGIINSRALKDIEVPNEKKPTAEEELRSVDVAACIRKVHTDYQSLLTPLRISDAARLRAELDARSAKLTSRREVFLQKIRSLPVDASRDPSILEPPGPFRQRSLDLLAEAARKVGAKYYPSKEQLLAEGIARTQHSIVRSFEEEIRDELQSISDASWNLPN
ncbi:MAG: hypothetical protein IPP88_16505 [Betaproteobacteria bacterium]|nr:hypothetical protein [Betaproteobacteria bacterium]